MNISMIGVGYVGLVTGVCFSEMGNSVFCFDIDQKKIEGLRNDIMPIYEEGLAEMASRNRRAGNLFFTDDPAEAMAHGDILFIAVGTPMGEDGRADLRYVMEAARMIGRNLRRDAVVVDKSTVPVGTAERVKATIYEELAARGESFKVSLVSNPEFLKEGVAIKDSMSPDRIVIGCEDEGTVEIMHDLYAPFIRIRERFYYMDLRSAEMTKYVSNAMLATRISFMNEMAGVCEAVGADINAVRQGVGSDSRIGYSFLYAGCGYGGSCFPKDVSALALTAEDAGCEAAILRSVESVNERQKRVLVKKALSRFKNQLAGKRFAVWGLAFKPGTDDVRCAPSLITVGELIAHGASVCLYDPAARETFERAFGPHPNVSYAQDRYSALEGADALFIMTEWKEFRSPDFERMRSTMAGRVIFDGRNLYSRRLLADQGFEYHQIGR